MTSCGNENLHGVNKCGACAKKCEGRGYPILLHAIHEHFIHNGRHPLFRVWKGHGLVDDYNEEWAASTRAP